MNSLFICYEFCNGQQKKLTRPVEEKTAAIIGHFLRDDMVAPLSIHFIFTL